MTQRIPNLSHIEGVLSAGFGFLFGFFYSAWISDSLFLVLILKERGYTLKNMYCIDKVNIFFSTFVNFFYICKKRRCMIVYETAIQKGEITNIYRLS